jgi:hypothetical protein
VNPVRDSHFSGIHELEARIMDGMGHEVDDTSPNRAHARDTRCPQRKMKGRYKKEEKKGSML